MRRSSVIQIAMALVLVLVAGACGSTAKKNARTDISGGGQSTDLASPGTSAAPGTSGKSSHSSGSVGGVYSNSSGGGSDANTPPKSRPAGVTSTFLPADGPGITNTTIYVGAGYSSQAAAGDRAIGAAGAAPSYDTRNVYNTVINYANKHGGFAGRVLKPLFVDFNLTDDTNTQEQAACAHWNQDNKVFLMAGGDDIFDSCAEKAHAIPLGGGSATTDTFKKYPHLIDPIGIANDRQGQLTVSGLEAAGYFSKGAKIGLVTWDEPQYRKSLQSGYIDTMSKYGLAPYKSPTGQTAIAYIMVPQNIGALGDMTAAVSSAVTKFKGMGVDHVMIQDGSAGVWSGDGLTFEWEQQSKSQKYYPRYGGNDSNAPGFTVNPHDEEDHGLYVSSADTDKKYDVGWHTNQTREACFKIQTDAGYPPQNDNDKGIAAVICDYFFFVQRVMNSSTELSNDGFIAAAEKLGKSFPTATVYGSNLFPGRHDGGDMVRTAEYLNSCQCLKYKGPPVYAD